MNKKTIALNMHEFCTSELKKYLSHTTGITSDNLRNSHSAKSINRKIQTPNLTTSGLSFIISRTPTKRTQQTSNISKSSTGNYGFSKQRASGSFESQHRKKSLEFIYSAVSKKFLKRNDAKGNLHQALLKNIKARSHAESIERQKSARIFHIFN